MDIKIIILLVILLVVGIIAYYWFDLGYQKKGQKLVTITAETAPVSSSPSSESPGEGGDASPEQETPSPTQEDETAEEEVTPSPVQEREATEPPLAHAYLAGGCFWCVEKDLEKLEATGDVVSGYSGGSSPNPTYHNHSDHREAVMVPYDPKEISYRDLLHYFFRHHDGTDPGGSFYDRGHSYTSAIYYQTEEERQIAEEVKAELNALGIFEQPIVTAIEAFRDFTIAEDYHQNYYKRDAISASKYRLYRQASGRDAFIQAVAQREAQLTPTSQVDKQETMTADNSGPVTINHSDTSGASHQWSSYEKPSSEVLRQQLTDLEYRVTQKDGTERAGTPGNLDDEKREGIFVDILSGEPLFSSTEKFDSGTGWPSFTQPIDMMFIQTRDDSKLWYTRTEVRSRYADNHLGHVFNDGPRTHNGQPSTGQRWCMNGAALTFVPREEMTERGYEDYLYLFN